MRLEETTHSAFEGDGYDGYRYGDRWDDEYDEDVYNEDGDGTRYEIQELIDSEVTLTHWTSPDGTRLEETSFGSEAVRP